MFKNMTIYDHGAAVHVQDMVVRALFGSNNNIIVVLCASGYT